jgi:chromosome segregation ATPase
MARAASNLVAHAAELERLDDEVAGQLATLADLAGRAREVRSRGAEVRGALERIPLELDELRRLGEEAEREVVSAREEVRLAEERLAALERKRRRRTEERERARREEETARQRLADANANVERLRVRAEQLRVDERSLREEEPELARAAGAIAAELRRTPRISEGTARDPGTTLAALEDWAQHVRSALLVARGSLEAERERIVVEANALGAAVLGESLGASSVALVRRRLETELG